MTLARIRRVLSRIRTSLNEIWILVEGRRLLRRARRGSRTFSVGDPAPSTGRPILLVVDDADPFGRYIAEILRCEGFAAFGVIDRSGLSDEALSTCDLVVLAPMLVARDELILLRGFVRRGGSLLVIRPDAALGELLGLRPTGRSLTQGYVQIGSSAPAWAELSSQPLRIDGPVDVFDLAGATPIASLSTSADGAQPHVAVSLRSLGQGGGKAAAFTFDLSRSVVHARQGNPSWAMDRRRRGPVRAIDLFIDPSSPGRLAWTDDERVEIPRADELQRLFANVVVYLTSGRRPTPRFWYFPAGEKALLVLTGDDHGKADVASRFERRKTFDDRLRGSGDDDANTVRATTYLWPDTPRRHARPQLSDEAGADFHAEGFEISLHPNAGRDDHRPEKLAYHLERSLRLWRSRYPSLPVPATLRWHCAAWAGWVEPALIGRVHGIRLDLNYYYFPADVVRDRPGFFTGSAMPMRFADADGHPIDVFQLCTQMTDESGQSYPVTVEALLDAALGDDGFFGAFAANVHTREDDDEFILDAIVRTARSRGVRVISARGLLDWLDAREASCCEVVGWDERTLILSIDVAPGAAGRLTLLLPASNGERAVLSIASQGTPVPFRRHLAKGIEYVALEPQTGTYEVSYGSGGEIPSLSTEEEEVVR